MGTKCAAHYRLEVPARGQAVVRLRLAEAHHRKPFAVFEEILRQRLHEADEFYAATQPAELTEDEKSVQRQSFAGLLWTKQWFHYDVDQWLRGDSASSPPPAERLTGRNSEWQHMHCSDVISMPDKWEYPWFAAWDLAFHCVPLALIDPEFAKRQLILMLREWYMHPNGQIPAYEWVFSDVNPPVHAWAAWRVYKIEKKMRGVGDTDFLEKIFHKLIINFTWLGQPQGPERQERLPGRLPRHGQHRRVRPQPPPAHRRPPRADRRHELDGHVLPQPDGDRARAGAHQAGLRGRRHQVLRALHVHRPGDEQHRRRGHRAVVREGPVSSTTCSRSRGSTPTSCASSRWSASSRSSPSRPSIPSCSSNCRASSGAWTGSSAASRRWPTSSRAGTCTARGNATSWRSSAATA